MSAQSVISLLLAFLDGLGVTGIVTGALIVFAAIAVLSKLTDK